MPRIPRPENMIHRPRVVAHELCAPKPVQVKVPQSKYEEWMELPAEVRTRILREAIDKALESKDLLMAN
jgi:chlorite dismutase